MEATGIYHENCAYYLYEKGFDVSIILPNKAKKYLEAIGLKSKNDSIDAKGLSQMGAQQCLELWEPMGTFFLRIAFIDTAASKCYRIKNGFKKPVRCLKFCNASFRFSH